MILRPDAIIGAESHKTGRGERKEQDDSWKKGKVTVAAGNLPCD